ncbi:membrane dipeptidase [Streptomyces alboflavus]|uniref:membrane dipeptidase n=1 Tax=Streptomyces alboflavus TaxID=67267 RepID=UPI003698F12F
MRSWRRDVRSWRTYVTARSEEDGVEDVRAHARRPLLAPHSACCAVTDVHRNLTDGQLKGVAALGGAVTAPQDRVARDRTGWPRCGPRPGGADRQRSATSSWARRIRSGIAGWAGAPRCQARTRGTGGASVRGR